MRGQCDTLRLPELSSDAPQDLQKLALTLWLLHKQLEDAVQTNPKPATSCTTKKTLIDTEVEAIKKTAAIRGIVAQFSEMFNLWNKHDPIVGCKAHHKRCCADMKQTVKEKMQEYDDHTDDDSNASDDDSRGGGN